MKSTGFNGVQDLTLLFEPDTLAQEQFYSILRNSHSSDPERRLMAAMLEDTVSCLSVDPRHCSRQQQKAFEEASCWMNAAKDDEWIFSFVNVCETLGLDPSYLRCGLNRWSAGSGAAGKPSLKKYRTGTRHRKLRFRAAL